MNNDKFEPLVHFIINECKKFPERLGAVRLNKVLWYSDLASYLQFGDTITGEEYVKREMGPVPKTILATLDKLEKDGRIEVKERTHIYDPIKYISKRRPDTTLLTKKDCELSKSLLNIVLGKTASEISDSTHEEIWQAADIGEEIPMYTALASGSGEITDEIWDWAQSEIKRLGLTPTS